jgi:hypothetical protein
MIRKGSKKREKRVLLKENGKERNKKNAKLKTHCFKYATIIYGPQIFEEKEQGFYNFKILRREKWQNRNVLVVQALPKIAVQKDLLWGEFWVDENNFAILRIDMSQKSIGNYYKIEERAMVLNSEPRIKTVMEYGVEKNGIQFPSKFSIEEAYINPRSEKIILSELLVTYNDYRFFKVGVNVKYRKSEKNGK